MVTAAVLPAAAKSIRFPRVEDDLPLHPWGLSPAVLVIRTLHPMVTFSVVPDVFEYMAPWPCTTLLSTIDHMSKALYLEFSWRSRPMNSVSAPKEPRAG